jgi:hypothetical protein
VRLQKLFQTLSFIKSSPKRFEESALDGQEVKSCREKTAQSRKPSKIVKKSKIFFHRRERQSCERKLKFGEKKLTFL